MCKEARVAVECPIDFIMIWVDGNDPEWQKEKRKYQPGDAADDREIRYRDWDNLQYWFRAVEKFAPWVNRIHFVTCGHLPKWLNLEHPKLNIVKHSDFIPDEYLPTFNSHTIELNLHRIKGLSEHFVYFNDDTFLNAKVKPEDFFNGGKPVDRLIISALCPSEDATSTIIYNNVRIINKHFSKKELLKKHWRQLFYPFYGLDGLKTYLTLPFNVFTGFQNDHLPNAYTKSLFEEVWNCESEILKDTCKDKFRSEQNVSQYIMRYWNLAKGNVSPCSYRHGKIFIIDSDENDELLHAISKEKYKMICFNDSYKGNHFEVVKQNLNEALDKVLPKKCCYEK